MKRPETTVKIVISYHGRQGGFFDPFSNAREKKRRSRFFPEHLKRGAKNYPTWRSRVRTVLFVPARWTQGGWWWFSWQHLYHCITISLYMCCVNMSAVWVVWNWTWVRWSKYWGIKSTCAAAGVFCRGHVSSLEIVCLYVFAVVCMCMVQQSDYSFVSLILATVMSSTTLSAVCFGWRTG